MTIKSRAHVISQAAGAVTFDCAVVDISEGGMRLSSKDPVMAVGQQIIVEIDFKEGLELRGRVEKVDPVEFDLSEENIEKSVVRWIDPQSGHFGVQFVELDNDRRKLL